tara:strand:- start:2120 stop:3706 length:1587 start_codon:yes stop_codon:yes gene_type:complete
MDAQFKYEKIKYHLFFFFILSINYLFPLVIFNEITLFYHDVLDVGVVYYHVLGKYLSGDKGSIKFFLNGNIEIEYLRHWLKPYTLLYAVFQTEFAYWITEILIKITAYISFFVLAKKISKDLLISSLGGALYACVNFGYIEGFGHAIFPYLLYLALFKNKLRLKNYLIIFFFGFNSDIVRDIFILPIILSLVWVINGSIFKKQFLIIIKLMLLFFIGMIISSSNLIYVQLLDGPFHREEFLKIGITYTDSIFNFFKGLVGLDLSKTWVFFFQLPHFVFLFPLIIISFLQKNKIINRFLTLFILINILITFLNIPIINDLRNNSSGILRSFNFHWIKVYLPIVSLLLFVFTLINKKFNKILFSTSFVALILFQINSSLVPLIKKNTQGEEYRNLYTFNGYYLPDDYKKVKNIVANSRVLSIGLDPMVAVMNDIKTIDGYHTLYPLKYKKDFRKIIKEELENNKELKNYYDNWGSRVYALISDPKNIRINFSEAKRIGADFIISRYEINHKDLTILCNGCSKYFKLYKIN